MRLQSFSRNSLMSAVVLLLLFLWGCGEGSSEKKLNNLNTHRLDSLLAYTVQNHEIPGAVALVLQNDSLLYVNATGYSNLEAKTTMQPNAIFRLASMTKGLTAVAILQLREQGKLELKDPIHKYIPEFSSPVILEQINPDSTFTAVPAQADITIHHLLTHSSGIGYGFQNDAYNALVIKNDVSEGFCDDMRSSMENTRKIAALPLLAEPGSEVIYSMSYDVLGTLIEVVSGLRYDQYITRHILEPLGMNDSFFTIPQEEENRLAKVYQPDSTGLQLDSTSYPLLNYPLVERNFYSGGADLNGTASDYVKFLTMLKQGGTYKGKQVLKKSSVDLMLQNQTPFLEGEADQGYSTWVVNEQGAKTGPMHQGSYGFGGFFDTYSWIDPSQDLIAILLLQMYPNNVHQVHERFQQEVYQLITEHQLTP